MEENLIKKNNSIEFDKSKCMKCTRCVQKCNSIGICHLLMKGEGKEKYVDFNNDNPCVNCGQCTLVCPFDSMREQSNIEEVKKLLQDKTKIKIVQCAPSIRATLNEGFKIEYNVNIEKKINTALKLLGFDKIFDVNFGADITSIIEGEELLERFEKKEHLPMFTACCPSWVNFILKYKPELKNNLTTAMSPHIHSGMAYKSWWAEKNNIDPKNIIVVSIMPCTSKKDEINIKSANINGIKAVDYVLTTRELIKLIKYKNIDFENLEESNGDPLSEYSGGGVIYGKSGGVMESALRVLKKKIDNEVIENLVFNDINMEKYSYKDAIIKIGNSNIKVAIISNPKNFKQFIDSEKYKEYHYIEVMNCNGGCINGGGQPLLPMKPNSEIELIEKRRSVLQQLDKNKIKRNAYDNENVKNYIEWSKNKSFKDKLFYVEF